MMVETKLLLIGWDAADWRIAGPLLDAGELPQLAEIVRHGVSANLRSQPPYLSPMLWNTIATGKSPAEHGIVGFTEDNPTTGAIQPISSRSRRCKALWNMLSQEGIRSTVVGWFASHPAEAVAGTFVSDAFGRVLAGGTARTMPAGCVSPATMADKLAPLRVGPEDIDPALLRFFLPRLDEIDRGRDRRPGLLLERLAELYSYHNTAVALLEHDASAFLAVYYHFIDWVCHDFITYAPPRRREVSGRDFELYGGVVDAAYRLQDLLLRDLLEQAGPDWNCIVLSDHGFQSGETRPARTPAVTAGPAAWHREHGLLAMAGPRFAPGKRLERVHLYDIAPTVLHAFGLPVGRDLPGRVLAEAFQAPAAVSQIPSWEDRGPRRSGASTESLSPREARELLQQFEDLGYIVPHADPFASAAALNERENAWNLGIALMDDARLEEALPALEQAFFHHPEEPPIASALARCQAQLGLIAESRTTARVLADYGWAHPRVRLELSELARLQGAPAEALEHLEAAETVVGSSRETALQRGHLLLLLERFEDAAEHFRALLAQGPNPVVALGLSRALVRLEAGGEAEPLLRALLEGDPDNALAWFSLGQALEQQGRIPESLAAFERAVALRPDFASAQGKRIVQEVWLAQSQGAVSPWLLGDHGFDGSGDAAARRQREERLARLRAVSRQRREQWQARRAAKRAQEGPARPFHVPDPGRPELAAPIVVVSGLPRSGTSLMMQMLARGGLPVRADDRRPPDAFNPRGYLEWEAVKDLAGHPECLLEAAGQAVKVVSLHLGALPLNLPYRVIWMSRELGAVDRSQRAMRAARTQPEAARAEVGVETLRKHRDGVLARLREEAGRPGGRLALLEVDYRDCIENTDTVVTRLQAFLGELLPHPERMGTAVEASLCHFSVESSTATDEID